jgi:hypothetical protein
MRTLSRTLALVITTTSVVGQAWAQQPVDPYVTPTPSPTAAAPPPVVAAPSSTTTVTNSTTTTTTTTALPQQPIDPYAAPPPPAAPPATFGLQPPSAGPGYTPAGPPSYQRGYYLYPAQPSYPVYYAPPRPYVVQPACCAGCARACAYSYPTSYPMVRRQPAAPQERIRRFSLGIHGVVMGINQTIGGDDMVMGGMGLQLRIRSKGRFGLELAQSFMRGEYWGGNFVRNSYPFTFGLMLYVFPNQDTRHFNLYGIAGVGAMLDSVNLRNQYNDMVTQDFFEWMAYAGLGAELRFKWFALAADARFVGLWRDDNSTPAAYYSGVEGGPIPSSSYGYQGKVYVNFWF